MIETETNSSDALLTPEDRKLHFKELRQMVGEEVAKRLVTSGPPKMPDPYEGSRMPKHRADYVDINKD